MADGTNEFKALDSGGYESTETVGALTITTTYDENFETGITLMESLSKTISLNHPFCAQFCVLGGASCSST